MTNKQLLILLHRKLTDHGEDPLVDYMHRLRAIIIDTPMDYRSPSPYTTGNSLDAILPPPEPPPPITPVKDLPRGYVTLCEGEEVKPTPTPAKKDESPTWCASWHMGHL